MTKNYVTKFCKKIKFLSYNSVNPVQIERIENVSQYNNLQLTLPTLTASAPSSRTIQLHNSLKNKIIHNS